MRVVQTRGLYAETAHPVRAVVVSHQGGVLRCVAETGRPTRSPWRSAGKPFQLLASLNAIDRAGHSENTPFTSRSLTDIELAIGASSHSGQPEHVDIVRKLLHRFGCTADALRCGAEPPAHAPSAAALLRSGAAPSALHNDCSGKHAMMLGACRANDWSSEYRPATHPLQQHIEQVVTELASETPAHAVDGCGVPVWILSVAAMAHAWAHLSWSMADPDRDPLLARIGAAMQEHPWHVSGDERIDLRLARAAAERYVGKIGAKGVFCIALPDREISIALKVESGDDAAVAVAARHVIDVVAPGALHPDPDFPWHHVKNVVGDTVGARHVEDDSALRVVTPQNGA